jgi:hypothetical protein
MPLGLNKRNDEPPVTRHDVRQSEKARPTKVTVRSSIMSGTIAPEVWIMSGLLLSLVQQIVSVNLLRKHVVKPVTNMDKNGNGS